MLIIDDADMEIDKDLTIGFTIEEALEFRKAIDDILKKSTSNHTHIMSRDTDRELTIFIYSDSKEDNKSVNESLSPKIKNFLSMREKSVE